MRMEFSRMSGLFVSQRPWRVDGRSIAVLFGEARDALASFYEGDEYSVWTKIEFFPNTPEQVQIIDSSGTVVIEYSLVDLLVDSGRCLGPRCPRETSRPIFFSQPNQSASVQSPPRIT